MQRELVWGEGTTVVEGLAKAFSEMLEEARVQAKDAVEAPARAVHQYRRALRRAESVLILAAPLMRGPQRRWLEEAVARGRRRTRVLRDLDAVVPLVPKLSEAIPSFDSSIFEALGKWLEQCRTELASEEIAAWRLRKNMRALAGLGDIFAVGLHGWADLDMLLDSAREAYRKARRAWKQARASEIDEDVHELRRRARTLRYQLELLSSREDLPVSADAKEAHAQSKSLVKRLGEVTDFMALRDVAAEAHIDAGFDAKGLKAALDGLIAERIEGLFEEAATFFEKKAREFLMPAVCAPTGADIAETVEEDEKAEATEVVPPIEGELVQAETSASA